MRDLTIGEKVKVTAAPASIYYKMNGEPVVIIGVCHDEDGNKIFTFKHSQLGFGALYRYGFKLI